MTIRVAMIEDDPSYREGLETFLTHSAGYELTDAFGSAEALLRHLAHPCRKDGPAPWDLVLMDVELPEASGVEATRRLKERFPEMPVVILTVFEDPAVILEGIGAGADGYLLKRTNARDMLASLGAIVAGGSPLTPAVARHLLDWVREGGGKGPAAESSAPARLDLTDRERDVLRCLVRGMKYAQAAEELGIGFETVRTHVRSIYRKLRVTNAAEAVGRAVRDHLV